MKLYTFPPAPSPERVHIFMREKSIEIESIVVDLMQGEQLKAEYKKINPNKTVPALVLDDGTTFSEVTAICHYLEALYPETPLYGANPKQKGLVSEWDHRIELECMAAIADALRNKSDKFKNRALPGDLDLEQIPELVPRGVKRITAFFAVLDAQLALHKYIAGDAFSMADISGFVAVKFARWVRVEPQAELKNLHRWFKEMSEREAFKTS